MITIKTQGQIYDHINRRAALTAAAIGRALQELQSDEDDHYDRLYARELRPDDPDRFGIGRDAIIYVREERAQYGTLIQHANWLWDWIQSPDRASRYVAQWRLEEIQDFLVQQEESERRDQEERDAWSDRMERELAAGPTTSS